MLKRRLLDERPRPGYKLSAGHRSTSPPESESGSEDDLNCRTDHTEQQQLEQEHARVALLQVRRRIVPAYVLSVLVCVLVIPAHIVNLVFFLCFVMDRSLEAWSICTSIESCIVSILQDTPIHMTHIYFFSVSSCLLSLCYYLPVCLCVFCIKVISSHTIYS